MDSYPFMIPFFQKYHDQALQENLKSKADTMAPGLTDKFYKHNIQNTGSYYGQSADTINRVIQYTIEGASKRYIEDMKLQNKGLNLDDLLVVCQPYFDLFERHFFDHSEVGKESKGEIDGKQPQKRDTRR